MTAQGLRRLILVASAALLLALLAWWSWPAAPAHGGEQASPVHAVAGAPAPAAAGPGYSRAIPRRDSNADPAAQAPPDTEEDAARGERCMADRDRQLLALREGLDPARSPGAALDSALLATALDRQTGVRGDNERRARAVQADWQTARRRWPHDLDLAWFAARHCSDELGCDNNDALQHLLEVDPGNAAAWAMAMGAALQRGDEGAYDRLLQRAAAAKAYDARTGVVFLRLQPLLEKVRRPEECIAASNLAEAEQILGHPPRTDDLAALEALTLEFALDIPAYSAFSGCGREGIARSPSRRRACIAVLSRLADGDTLIEQNISLPRLIELTRGTPENVRLRERYRRMLWLWQFANAPMGPDSGFAQILANGEIASLRERAIAQHRWPPPTDWLPENGRARALILTGE